MRLMKHNTHLLTVVTSPCWTGSIYKRCQKFYPFLIFVLYWLLETYSLLFIVNSSSVSFAGETTMWYTNLDSFVGGATKQTISIFCGEFASVYNLMKVHVNPFHSIWSYILPGTFLASVSKDTQRRRWVSPYYKRFSLEFDVIWVLINVIWHARNKNACNHSVWICIQSIFHGNLVSRKFQFPKPIISKHGVRFQRIKLQ